MYGSFVGNLLGILYFVYFQLTGIALIHLCFPREKSLPRLLLGSVSGSLLLTWLPILLAFFFDFTVVGHLFALVLTLPIWVCMLFKKKPTPPTADDSSRTKHLPFLVLLGLFMVFWCYLLHTHTILPNQYGGMDAGQCTYGDMNMHLGFITSLAVQQTFPPDYSIMPGVKLSYPFLSDSISSSLYLLGASLRVAYIVPMIFRIRRKYKN